MGAARGSDGVVVDNNTDRSHKAHQQLGGSRVHVAVLVSIANLGCNLLDFQSNVFFPMGDSQSGYLKADAWTFEILHLWRLKC